MCLCVCACVREGCVYVFFFAVCKSYTLQNYHRAFLLQLPTLVVVSAVTRLRRTRMAGTGANGQPPILNVELLNGFIHTLTFTHTPTDGRTVTDRAIKFVLN